MNSKKSACIKKPQSINRALLHSFLIFALLLTLIVEVACFVVVKSVESFQVRKTIANVGDLVVRTLLKGKDIDGLIKDYSNDGIIIHVLDDEGKAIKPIDAQFKLQNFQDKKDSIKYGYFFYHENSKINYIAIVPHTIQPTYVLVSYSMEISSSGTWRLIWYFVLIWGVVLWLAVFISNIVSHKLADGLNNLSATAVRFSKGDYEVNFANAEYSELADLSDTLNSVRDEVKRSGDFKRELLANVTHDLKTPLTMIKAYAAMIKEISGDNKEKREKHLQVIIDEADRLTGLVNDVLNVSKVSSKLSEINFKIFNLTEFLYGIINKFNYLQETQGYKIMVDVEQNLYTRADEEKIEQVIYNLLGNAVNYTGEDKTVYITLKRNLAGDRINLRIKDTGKGISKEDLPDIWNRYYRIKETHTRPVKGSGLGLNIVKVILENHSFDFGVESEQGKGAMFWIDFPAVPSNIESIENNES